MKNRSNMLGAVCLLPAAFGLLGLAGCGGGGGGTTAGGVRAERATGGLQFQIIWPSAASQAGSGGSARRLIPLSTQFITIDVTDPATSQLLTPQVTVARTADPVQRVIVNDLRAGAVRVRVQALDNANTPLAEAETDTTVSIGLVTDVDLTLFPFAPPPPPGL